MEHPEASGSDRLHASTPGKLTFKHFVLFWRHQPHLLTFADSGSVLVKDEPREEVEETEVKKEVMEDQVDYRFVPVRREAWNRMVYGSGSENMCQST